MKNQTTTQLSEFEKSLSQFVKERPRVPFSTEEVLGILQAYNPPENLEQLQDEKIVQVMSEYYKKRFQQDQKLKNLSRINSLGDLLQTYREFMNFSTDKLAWLFGLSKEDFEAYENDRLAPDLLEKSVLLNLICLTGISIQQMIQILEKTARLFWLNRNSKLAPVYAQIEKGLLQTGKMRVRDSAQKELCLTLSDNEAPEIEKFKNFRNELLAEYEKNRSDYENPGECLTIKTRKRSDQINKILQLL